MKRRLLNLLIVLSLLLCVGAAGLWAWSYRRLDVVKWRGNKAAASVLTFHGGFHVGWAHWVNPGGRATGFAYDHMPAEHLPRNFDFVARCAWRRRLAGFAVGFDATPAGDRGVHLRVPLASVACVAAVAPLLAWRRRARRARRVSRGLCVRCGYDLRGTPGACPECGAVVSAR